MRVAQVTPRDDWNGQGLMGADISFGFLNRLPLRRRDKQRIKKQQQMKTLFSGLNGGPREPTMEDISDDEGAEQQQPH